MATRARPRRGARRSIATGPWKSVRDTRDPWDGSPEQLVDATNCYICHPLGGSGLYARRGFQIANLNDPLPGRGQAVCTHVALDGNSYNFIVAAGRLLRTNAGLTTYDDVTPTAGVVIDPNVTRVYFVSFADQLIISDGVNPPWIADNLGDPVLTGTYIDFDSLGTTWSAYGQPVEYSGSLFFVINEVGGDYTRTDIAWSAPGNPTVGYQQTDFDYRWTLEQTGSTPIYALWGTNVGLFYFRDKSIGMIAGTPGPDLQQSHTADAIADNVGCLQSATIRQFGNTIFFCDAGGRSYMLPLGGSPQPIWLQLRSVVDDSTSEYPAATAQVACAVIEPSLNLYIAAIWSPVPGVADAPLEMQVFDTKTGFYVGRWIIANGASVQAIGILNNNAGYANLVVLGDTPPLGGIGEGLATEDLDYLGTEDLAILGTIDYTAPRPGCVWAMNAVLGDGDEILSEDEDFFIAMEDGTAILTESVLISWKDQGVVPIIGATTQRLGYAEDHVLNIDSITTITGNNSPCRVTTRTTTSREKVQGTPTPSTSEDDTFRLVVGSSLQGRGCTVTVQPTEAETQWSLQRVSAIAIPSLASAIEP